MKWFYVIWLITCNKRGISSCQISRDIGVSQKLHGTCYIKFGKLWQERMIIALKEKLRLMNHLQVEKNANRHKDKKVERCQGRSFKDKVPVFWTNRQKWGFGCQSSKRNRFIKLLPIIRKYVEEGSTIYTDGWDYGEVSEMYNQISVDHGHKYYGITYYNDNKETVMITTNTIENAWSVFKRIYATYYHISKKYMQRYVDEFVFRFNTRKLSDSDRFRLLLQYKLNVA